MKGKEGADLDQPVNLREVQFLQGGEQKGLDPVPEPGLVFNVPDCPVVQVLFWRQGAEFRLFRLRDFVVDRLVIARIYSVHPALVIVPIHHHQGIKALDRLVYAGQVVPSPDCGGRGGRGSAGDHRPSGPT